MKHEEWTDRMDAKADLDALIPKYKSNAEREWASLGNAILQDHFDTPVAYQHYEPVRFAIPGGKYTPDFLHVLEDGRIVFVEVKGSKKQRGYRSSRQKLRAAAEMYPFFTWVQAIGGTVEEIG